KDAALQLGREHELTKSYGNRGICKSKLAIICGHECFARHHGQCVQDARIENFPGADLLIHHLLTSCQRIHNFSCVIKAADYGQFPQAIPCPCAILATTMIATCPTG